MRRAGRPVLSSFVIILAAGEHGYPEPIAKVFFGRWFP